MKQQKLYIYGKHAVEEALAHKPEVIKRVFTTPTFSDNKLESLFKKENIQPKKVDSRLGNHDGVSHQGVFAEVDREKLTIDVKTLLSNTDITPDTCIVVLDEIQDPHNVGAIIRSAAGFGAQAVILPTHSQAQVSAAVIKVSAGMAFRIPLVQVSNINSCLRDLKSKGFWVYGLVAGGDTAIDTETFDKPTVFVMGNEGKGIHKKTEELCDFKLSIPIHPQCESLNVAATTAVTLYQWSVKHPSALSQWDGE